MIQLSEHFGNDSRYSPEAARRKQWFIKARQDKAHQEDLTERAADNATAFGVSAIVATEIQIEQFEAKLDVYDEATVKALMLNQEKLDAVNAQIEDMLERAYVMEDGRRVFKTEDGSQVFDENGKEVTQDELDFSAIDPNNPTWESYKPVHDEKTRILQEREQIHAFQEKVDAARERVADGEISKPDLDDLDAELADAMPPSVKTHVSGFDTAGNAAAAKTAFTANANPETPTNPVAPTNDLRFQ